MVLINYNDNIIKSKYNDFNSIYKFVESHFNFKSNSFYLVCNGKLITKYSDKLNENDNINVFLRVKGGIMKILEPVFSPILTPLKDIALAAIGILELVIEIVKLIPNILELLITIFQPDRLINDIIYAIMTGISTMTGALFGKFTYGKTKPDKNEPGGGIFGIEDKSKRVCVTPSFINLMILVLCPPLALYLKLGFSIPGVFMVIICCLMTYYLYYFPGFIFAALHILC